MDQTEPVILRSLTDEAIGERRQVLLAPDGRALSLRLHRWSWEGRKARWGDTYAARVRTLDKSRRGAHLDLGLKDEMGFLPGGEPPAQFAESAKKEAAMWEETVAKGKLAVD